MTTPFNGADAMVRMLQYNGVKHIFGLCGDTSLPFYDAMARLDHGMDHILTRDERSAGYMADAYARVTGKVGVCEGPSGGGIKREARRFPELMRCARMLRSSRSMTGAGCAHSASGRKRKHRSPANRPANAFSRRGALRHVKPWHFTFRRP